MNTEKKIEIMKAFTEGKVIQCKALKYDICIWCDDDSPIWDWNQFEYRIKPESTYRPYKNAEEMIKDIKKRLVAIQHPVFSGVWLKRKNYNEESLITSVDYVSSQILLHETWFNLSPVFYGYTYLDGSPFGIKE